MRTAALVVVLAFAPAAFAEPAMIACQPDRVIKAGKTERLTDAALQFHSHRVVFAYDLDTGKACAVNTQYKMCVPDGMWKVMRTENAGQITFSRTARDNKNHLYLVNTNTGMFRASLGDYELASPMSACKPFTEFKVDPPK